MSLPTLPTLAYEAYAGSMRLTLSLMQRRGRVRSLELMPPTGSPLYLADDRGEPMPLHVPADPVMGPTAVLAHRFDVNKQRFLNHALGQAGPGLMLIDVGANVGYFTRQCLATVPRVARAWCYEPSPDNHRLLVRNMAGLERVRIEQAALGDMAGRLAFHTDPDNTGNHSLLPQAMPPSHGSIDVEVRHAAAEQSRWLADWDGDFVYKSDTQGMDQRIAVALGDAFWRRVRAGIFELWRLPGSHFDAAAFEAVLAQFSNRVFEKQPRHQVTPAEVIDYLHGTDQQFDDLLVWR